MERLAAMGVLGACTWEFPAPGRCRGACTCRRAGRRAERRGAGRPWPERRASRLRGSPRLPRRGSSHGGNLEMAPWFLLAVELGHGEAGAPCARTRGPSGP